MSDRPATTNLLVFGWRLSRVGVHLVSGCLQLALSRDTLAERRLRIGRWSRQLLHICGMRIEVAGESQPLVSGDTGCLWVANHVSWLDIFAINALVPVRFVAKDDIRQWGMVGWLVARADTIFIRRGSRAAAQAMNDTLRTAMQGGARVALFPEGTTTDGYSLKPFKSGLFQAATEAEVPVQPIALHYPLPGGGLNPAPAYYDDISLWQCLCAVLRQRQSVVVLQVLSPIATQGLDRQAVSRQAQAQIADCLREHGVGTVAAPDADSADETVKI